MSFVVANVEIETNTEKRNEHLPGGMAVELYLCATKPFIRLFSALDFHFFFSSSLVATVSVCRAQTWDKIRIRQDHREPHKLSDEHFSINKL